MAQEEANRIEARRREDERVRNDTRARRDDVRFAIDDLLPGATISPQTRDEAVNLKATMPERFSPKTVQYADFDSDFVGPPPADAKHTVSEYTLNAGGQQQQQRQFGKSPETVLLDGKPIPAVFDPGTGRYSYRGEDVTDRIEHYNRPPTPYTMPVNTPYGIVPWDTRGGGATDPSGGNLPLRPPASAEQALTNAQALLWTIGEIEKVYNPESVGPLRGRYESIESALSGNKEETIKMQTMLSTFQNTVINLRTGAQMSEPEAQRILNEIPSMNLPPETFVGKLNTAKAYFQEWYRNRSKMAFGRMTPGEIDTMTTSPGAGQGTTPNQDDIYQQYLNRTRQPQR
jgi:hypothetical protein